LANLKALDLGDNPALAHLPVDLAIACPTLVRLGLAGCGFKHLPPCIGDLQSLEWVDLRGNAPLADLAVSDTWLNLAIAHQQRAASSMADAPSAEVAVFHPPSALVTIAAAPIQERSPAALAETHPTAVLALVLAQRAVSRFGPGHAIDLSHRGLRPADLEALAPTLVAHVEATSSARWVAQAGLRRVSSLHHAHALVPAIKAAESSSQYRVDGRNACDLCHTDMPGPTGGFICEDSSCAVDVCGPCGTFLHGLDRASKDLGHTPNTTVRLLTEATCAVSFFLGEVAGGATTLFLASPELYEMEARVYEELNFVTLDDEIVQLVIRQNGKGRAK
jgi:hypothetical protein